MTNPNVDHSKWMAIARRCDYATFFHTPIWERAVLDAFPAYRSCTLEAELRSGDTVIYPLLEVQRRLKGAVRGYVSTFAGCYGGPIAEDAVNSSDWDPMRSVSNRWNTTQVWVTGNPLAPEIRPPSSFRETSDFTHILSLDPDYQNVARGFKRDHRQDIATARKANVVVAPATRIEDWERYFGIYHAALDNWGERATSDYPWPLFRSLFERSREYPENIRLWLARRDGELVAGGLMFYWNSYAVYWHAARDPALSHVSPAKLVLATAIEHACAAGYRYFDFNPSGGHAKVAEFKSRFGAVPWPVTRFHFERPALRTGRHIRARVRA